MFYRLKKYISHSRFYRQTRRILDTPPLQQKDAPLAIVSMVHGQDVQMYILAIKALYRRLGRGKVVVIPDQMSQRSRDLIVRHLGSVEFVELNSINTGPCQRGGTWERLLYCVDRSQREFVIQIDSDVLCIGPIQEVLDCINQNRAFALSEGQSIKPLMDWVEDGLAKKSDHIVSVFETRGKEFPGSERLMYLRASSGFTGFAKNAVTRNMIEIFHAGGVQVHGERWKEWGTEQLGSNLAIANSPGALPLPYPKYSTFEPEYAPFQRQGISDDTSLLHFIGIFRFDMNVFPTFANREIDAMLGDAASRKQ